MNRRSFLHGATGLGFTLAVDGRAFASDVEQAAADGAPQAPKPTPASVPNSGGKQYADETHMHRQTREAMPAHGLNSPGSGRSAAMVRAAQPETIRDYRLLAELEDGSEVVLAEVLGNYQRLRRHSFETVRAKRLRIHVSATNGSEQVRLFEVRCYA